MPKKSVETVELISQLFEKECLKSSWINYIAERRRNNRPINEKKLKELQLQLLEYFDLDMRFINGSLVGGFFEIEYFFLFYFSNYLRLGVFDPNAEILYFKISWDGTPLRHSNSEGLWICPTEVNFNQKSKHVWEVARYAGKENNDNLVFLFKEVKVQEFLEKYNGATLCGKKLQFFLTADWNALCYFYKNPMANNKNYQVTICMFCGCSKYDACFGWAENPFFCYMISRTLKHKEAALNTSIDNVFYDPMHGFARLLSLTFDNTYLVLADGKKKIYKTAVSSALTYGRRACNWNPKKSLSMQNLKQIFVNLQIFDNFVQTIKDCLDFERIIILNLPDCNKAVRITDLIPNLFRCFRNFYLFIYTADPTTNQLEILDKSRTFILGSFAALNWRLDASPHYMLHHFFEKLFFFHNQNTVNKVLNEGVERKNFVDKQIKEIVGGNSQRWSYQNTGSQIIEKLVMRSMAGFLKRPEKKTWFEAFVEIQKEERDMHNIQLFEYINLSHWYNHKYQHFDQI